MAVHDGDESLPMAICGAQHASYQMNQYQIWSVALYGRSTKYHEDEPGALYVVVDTHEPVPSGFLQNFTFFPGPGEDQVPAPLRTDTMLPTRAASAVDAASTDTTTATSNALQ